MNFQLCTRCKKHYAIMNVTKVEGDKVTNEYLCAKCAKEMGLKVGNMSMDMIDTSDEALEAMDEQIKTAADMLADPDAAEELKKDFASSFDTMKSLLSRPRDDKSGLSEQGDSDVGKHGNTKETNTEKQQREQSKYLEQYCLCLTRKARENKLDDVVGRDREIFRVIQILCRRTKNNPCLIGEPGVGKTAIAEGIAIKIARKEVPEKLINKELYLLDLTALVAGTQFRGQFESRVKGLIEEVKKRGNVILVIDEVHNLVATGDSEGTMSAANMMKPALSRGDIQVIGATTLNEYRKYIEKDSALERRFQPVTVDEPSISEATEMLKGIKGYYENFHKIKIPMLVVQKAVELSERYITDRFLPDKAIDLIDEACSNSVLKNPVYDKLARVDMALVEIREKIEAIETKEERAEEDYMLLAELKSDELKRKEEQKSLQMVVDSTSVTVDDLYAVIELWTAIPASKISEGETEKLKNLKTNLSRRIVGQDRAIEAISAAVKRGRISIIPRKRPVSFILTGPTGVGKTELVKLLSKELFDSPETLIRLDMSEFMEKHSVSRIIGSPPGYVGYDEAGQLTEKIRRKPYSVVLFDEIEKAHPDVLNILLQILDDGTITDAHGVKVSFEHTLIVMTSNAGSNIKGTSAGFNKTEAELSEAKAKKALGEFLRPEFLNRVDEIIVFDPLGKELFPDIVKIYLQDLKDGFAEKEISFGYTEEALALLADKSYSREYGARNVRRVVQKEIEDRVVNAICDGNMTVSGVNVDAENGEIKITLT